MEPDPTHEEVRRLAQRAFVPSSPPPFRHRACCRSITPPLSSLQRAHCAVLRTLLLRADNLGRQPNSARPHPITAATSHLQSIAFINLMSSWFTWWGAADDAPAAHAPEPTTRGALPAQPPQASTPHQTQPQQVQAASASEAKAAETQAASSSGEPEAKSECPICVMMRKGGCEKQFHVSWRIHRDHKHQRSARTQQPGAA